jgi:hypothetical protein
MTDIDEILREFSREWRDLQPPVDVDFDALAAPRRGPRRRTRVLVAAGLVAAVAVLARPTSGPPRVRVGSPTSGSTNTTGSPQSARVHVSLLLPSPSIVSGQGVNATLVIQNDSGTPVLSDTCVPPGESVLGQMGLATYPPPTTPPPTTTTTLAPNASTASRFPALGKSGGCLGPTHEIARVGTTRVTFTLEASSSLCQLAPAAQLQVDACLPGGAPLRPGTYYIDYDWYGPLPSPAITVPVVAATK